jgi:hypothetical protein
MSDNMQTKSNQLISAPPASGTDDDMFTGLGLGDYVAKKDTGAIATGLMSQKSPAMYATAPTASSTTSKNLSLEDKRRLAMEAESLQRFKPSPMVMAPSSQATSQAKPRSRDLTDTLMSKNLGQMNISQSMNQFPSTSGGTMSASPSFGMASQPASHWGNFSQAGPMGFQAGSTGPQASSMGPNARLGQQAVSPGSPQQQLKPDLSSFDRLLSMPSQQQPKKSMGAMMTPMGSANAVNTNAHLAASTGVKSLTANDISDFLS